jgi:transposase
MAAFPRETGISPFLVSLGSAPWSLSVTNPPPGDPVLLLVHFLGLAGLVPLTLGLLPNAKSGSQVPFVVFNPLSWDRTDVVKRQVVPPAGYSDFSHFTLRDDAGKETPFECTGSGRPGPATLIFVAQGVPAIGTRTFLLEYAGGPAAGKTAANTEAMENEFLRATFGKGGIKSLYDKRQKWQAFRTVRAIDLRYLERWSAGRRKPALRQMGVDELYLGKKQRFVTVVSNLESREPLWFGAGRKKETLDEFFGTQLSRTQRGRIEAACLDMWEPYRLSLADWVPGCRLVYDKFHILQHANGAIDEVRRAEFFRQGGWKRELVKGKRWLLLSRWVNLNTEKKRQLNQLFSLNRRVMKAYLLKESLSRLWDYRYEGAMLRYLQSWIDQLRWQRLKPFEKLAWMLLDHLDGILNYCRTRIAMGVVEAINGNIKALLRRGRGYKNLRYLLLKAQRMAVTRTEFVTIRKAA